MWILSCVTKWQLSMSTSGHHSCRPPRASNLLCGSFRITSGFLPTQVAPVMEMISPLRPHSGVKVREKLSLRADSPTGRNIHTENSPFLSKPLFPILNVTKGVIGPFATEGGIFKGDPDLPLRKTQPRGDKSLQKVWVPDGIILSEVTEALRRRGVDTRGSRLGGEWGSPTHGAAIHSTEWDQLLYHTLAHLHSEKQVSVSLLRGNRRGLGGHSSGLPVMLSPRHGFHVSASL